MGAVISVASCEAEADPGYFYGAYPALYNAYPNWPGVTTPYSQSTCYGCYGKRSADAEADPAYFVARSPQGLSARGFYYGKRSADAEPGYLAYGYGYAPLYRPAYSSYGVSQAHPGLASSFQAVTRF